jgi:mRNA-degrading endonuclease RelE of RelBE toxin-antitoxin system
VPAARCASLTRRYVKRWLRSLTAWPPIRVLRFPALTGRRPYLRVRSGDYRVIYAVDDQARIVTIAAVGHRREIYRSFDM